MEAPAVLGVTAGGWTEEIAKRIPAGARVILATDQDKAGEKYARSIAATLQGYDLRRWKPPQGAGDANDELQAGRPLDAAAAAPYLRNVPLDNDGREVFAAEPEPTTVEPYPLRNLADYPPEPTRWLVNGLLPEEACLIVGAEEKSGKSWCLFDLAICIASGQPFLDEYKPTHLGKTLVYSPESGWAARSRRMWGLCWGRGLDPAEVLPDIPFLDARLDMASSLGVARLKATVEQVQPALVIVDPLISAHLGLDENDSGEVQAVLNSIRELTAVQPGLVVAVAHHLNKGHKGQSGFHGLRGSSALGAWSDGLIKLSKLEDTPDSIRRISVEHRDAPGPPPAGFQLVVEDGPIEGLNSFILEPQNPSLEAENDSRLNQDDLEAVLQLVLDESGTLSRYAGAKKLGWHRDKFYRYFEELERKGSVRLNFRDLMVICD